MTSKILLLVSTGILGIFLGTQLAEAALIVPYWKGLPPDDFFTFYKDYGKKLHQFYAPLTILAIILPVSSLVFSFITKQKIDLLMWGMVIFSLLFFATFFFYFKEANISFTERTILNETLPQALNTWANWHWTRVFFEAIAFICGLILLLKKQFN